MEPDAIALELLAPARDADTAIAAIMHGADAVYIGGPAFGARAAAGNSLDDIKRAVEAAHPYGVKVYVTLNTILYDNELDEARRLVGQLYDIGVDALIVQDMALLEMDLAPIELHASTQTDARTPDKVRMLSQAGFAQIVLPREFSLDEIRAAAEAAPESRMEVFVHGALCVSYSGDCHAGYAITGRSANRGECPQICRLEYTLEDRDGHRLTGADGKKVPRHWLSLADMNRLDYLAELADAGARSFKIEGRLKGPSYVKQVTAAYSRALDRLVERSEGRYRRASYGRCHHNFTPDVAAAFNRGFTPYFLHPGDTRVSMIQTPKYVGVSVGTAMCVRKGIIEFRGDAAIHPGDGLGWFDRDGRLHGFRVNRAEPGRIYPAPGSDLPDRPDTPLYRNRDAALENRLSRSDSAERRISLAGEISIDNTGHAVLTLSDERGCRGTAVSEREYRDAASTPPHDYRRNLLSRLGNTIYRLDSLDDRAGDIFIPASELSELRRRAIEILESQWGARPRPMRRACHLPADALSGVVTTYHDNVSNRLSRQFYTGHGATVGEDALEASPRAGEKRVMTTRYCLRREAGECMRRECPARRWPAGDLYLRAQFGRLRLHFDCARCRMEVYHGEG